MNKVITSIILALGLISTAAAQQPLNVSQTQDPNEIIELSAYSDGNYNVEQLLVMDQEPTVREFIVHYKINSSQFAPAWDNNSAEITAIRDFVERVEQDSTMQIIGFEVVGYTSPDGAAAYNKRVADSRASNFCNYLDTRCNMAQVERTVSSSPYMWIDTKTAIENSSVPNKAEVLAIIESSKPQSEIQKQLEAHSAAWSYICNHILPPMRNVELDIRYNTWRLVESRTLVEQVEPQSEIYLVTNSYDNVNTDENSVRGRGRRGRDEICDDEPFDDHIYCMIVEMPENAIDYDCGCTKEREKIKTTRHGAKLKERGRDNRAKLKERDHRLKLWSRR